MRALTPCGAQGCVHLRLRLCALEEERVGAARRLQVDLGGGARGGEGGEGATSDAAEESHGVGGLAVLPRRTGPPAARPVTRRDGRGWVCVSPWPAARCEGSSHDPRGEDGSSPPMCVWERGGGGRAGTGGRGEGGYPGGGGPELLKRRWRHRGAQPREEMKDAPARVVDDNNDDGRAAGAVAQQRERVAVVLEAHVADDKGGGAPRAHLRRRPNRT